jgi:hypothetical protein
MLLVKLCREKLEIASRDGEYGHVHVMYDVNEERD